MIFMRSWCGSRRFVGAPPLVLLVWLTLIIIILAGTTWAEEQENGGGDDDPQTVICQAVKDSLYKTDLERTNDPCSACDYDLELQQLTMECKYEYCRECDTELQFCGYRSVQIDTTLSNETIEALMISPQNTTVGSTKQWCIYYDEGELGGRNICVDVDESFNSNCESRWEDLPYGLPLLSCDVSNGCQCKIENSGIAKTDPFIGLERLEFATCYNPDATAATHLSSGPKRHWTIVISVALMATTSLLIS